MKSRYLFLILILIFLASTFFFSLEVFAASDTNAGGTTGGPTGSGATQLDNPLGNENSDPRVIIGNVIKAALGIVGSLALVVFILGGFTWVTAAGNDEKIKKGKDMIIWASLGLAVIFTSYALVIFVIKAITG